MPKRSVEGYLWPNNESSPAARAPYKLLAVRDIDEHGRRDHRRPQTVAIANRRLGHVARRHDLVRHAPYVLALVVAEIWIEIDAENRREHHRRQILGVVARLLIRLTGAVMLRQVS